MSAYITYKNLGKMGRLGNQLWQICGTAGAIAEYNYKNKTDYKIAMPQWEYRNFFSFPDDWFINETIIKKSKDVYHIVKKENSVYLGDIDLLNNIENDIQEWLLPSDESKNILKKYIKRYKPQDKTCIHVRRGDYQYWYKGINLLPKEYFEKNWPEGEVLLFSDDPEWCKENIPKAIIVHHNPAIDLLLMRMCKAHIISNSTFAWWGAYGSKSVIYPNPWVKQKYGNLIPKGWNPSSWS